jgi:hypothetical protein
MDDDFGMRRRNGQPQGLRIEDVDHDGLDAKRQQPIGFPPGARRSRHPMAGFDQQACQSLAYRARRASQKDPATHF